MTSDARQAPLFDPVNAAMGVHLRERGENGLVYEQELGKRFHDHRGQSTLGSVGVLLDTAVAGTIYASLPSGQRSVAASLTVSSAKALPAAGIVTAFGRSEHVDVAAGTGLASGSLRDADGDVCAIISARGVVVDRKFDHSGVEGEPRLPSAGVAVADTDAELSQRLGLDVVQGMALGEIPRGAMADLLELELRIVETGAVTAVLTPQEWMANSMGTLQGGILLAVADQICGLAAETATDPGERYRVLDLRTDFVRSPDVTGPDIRLEANVVRVGRRIELVEARIATSGGKLLTRASASVQRF
ncbi:PaaI family thioesterase [Tomitella biformata]|uniref:PaaI family thioesterase n=1 Tax=Tomitella biformata TaxID=630403 RepID=UPI000465D4A9|nr:hotdog fold thioesterase [Tomitella biformata]